MSAAGSSNHLKLGRAAILDITRVGVVLVQYINFPVPANCTRMGLGVIDALRRFLPRFLGGLGAGHRVRPGRTGPNRLAIAASALSLLPPAHAAPGPLQARFQSRAAPSPSSAL
jgi:hypothetical protein